MTLDVGEFRKGLLKEGFPEPVEVMRAANGSLDLHSHPFEARALVLEGEIQIEIDGVGRTYSAGDIFQVPANRMHSERYGPTGVKYLVGRKS